MSDWKSKLSANSSNGVNKRLKTCSDDSFVKSNYTENLKPIHRWYSSGVRPDESVDISGVRLIDSPFKVISFEDFICDLNFVDDLKKEIKLLDLNFKNNDLYRLRQSVDLNNIESGPIARLCQVFRQQLKPLVEEITEISLNENIALTVSRYEHNDYLLCHDDDIEDEGRRIAFIWYLVPEWNKSDGGLLDLYDTKDNDEPSKVVESLVPKSNMLTFFEVNPVSWHQVSEVLSDSKIRLSINGWFHGPPRVRPTRYVEPKSSTDTAIDVPLEVVKSWINPLYLNDSTQIEIQSRFGELSEIVLQDFFVSDKYQELSRALIGSEAIDWHWMGPPNMRRFESALPTSCPAIISDAFKLFKSEAMFLILSNLTGLKLHELAVDVNSDEEEEDSNDTSEPNPRCRGDIRRWSHSCYTLVHDNGAETNEGEALDVVIHFNCQKDYDFRENGGFISYIAKGEDEELLTIDPNDNCLNIVFRDKKTTRFVKYINSKCADSYQDISFVYYQ